MHGADSVSTGVREMWTGEPQESGTHALVRRGLTAASVSEKTASTVATVVDVGAGVGAGIGVGLARAASAGAAAAAEGAADRGSISADA